MSLLVQHMIRWIEERQRSELHVAQKVSRSVLGQLTNHSPLFFSVLAKWWFSVFKRNRYARMISTRNIVRPITVSLDHCRKREMLEWHFLMVNCDVCCRNECLKGPEFSRDLENVYTYSLTTKETLHQHLWCETRYNVFIAKITILRLTTDMIRNNEQTSWHI